MNRNDIKWLKEQAKSIASNMYNPTLFGSQKEREAALATLAPEVFEQIQMMSKVKSTFGPVPFDAYVGGKSITAVYAGGHGFYADLALQKLNNPVQLYDYNSEQLKTVNVSATCEGVMICVSWWS